MFINDLLHPVRESSPYTILIKECSDYLSTSEGIPLVKNLSKKYTDIQKVKVRLRKKNDQISETFNKAFKHQAAKMHQRAVFANGMKGVNEDSERDLFYVFPLNGFKFMYNSEIVSSTKEYKTSFDIIFEQFDEVSAGKILSDLLKYTYTSTQLTEGLQSGAEIIIYNIAYYYAVRVDSIEYNELLTSC